MVVKRYAGLHLGLIVLLWLSIGLITACGGTENQTKPNIQTILLVRAPDVSLPLNKPIEVKSRTDAPGGVSHVELYAVEMPSGDKNVLIRSDPVSPDATSFSQTTFTASQEFIPKQAGHYIIKVVGYNQLGEKSDSNYIGFDVK